MRSNAMVAMILAGGRGSRLHDLTKKVAKPAVHFGGKYRIIDFPLSNCANSGINTVGVLTQYESVLLNAYVAKDQFWGLDTMMVVYSFFHHVKEIRKVLKYIVEQQTQSHRILTS